MRHRFRFRHLAAVAAVFAALAVGSARADVVPDSRPKAKPCVAPGQPCNEGGPEEDQEGTCVAATRTVQVRNREGGMTPVPVPFFQCIAGAKGSKSQAKPKSSGCAVAPERGDAGSLAVTMSFLAGLMLLAARRRNAVG